jgi:hypothetical protein
MLRYGLSGLMLAACLALIHPALAEMMSFKAELKGSNECRQTTATVRR